MSYTKHVEITAPVQRVWQAWTNQTETQRWLAPRSHVDFVEGGAYEFFWDEDPKRDSTLGCKILSIQLHERLRFEWKGKTEYRWMFEPPHGPTEVEVRFTGDDGTTQVAVEQAETRDLTDWPAYDAWMSTAWGYALAQLKSFCEGSPSGDKASCCDSPNGFFSVPSSPTDASHAPPPRTRHRLVRGTASHAPPPRTRHRLARATHRWTACRTYVPRFERRTCGAILLGRQCRGEEAEMALTASKVRADIYRLLDQVLETGVPIEIERKGRILKIVSEPPASKLTALQPHPGTIVGDPEDVVHIDWSSEWRP